MDCGLSCMYVIIAVVHYNDVYVLKSVQIKKKHVTYIHPYIHHNYSIKSWHSTERSRPSSWTTDPSRLPMLRWKSCTFADWHIRTPVRRSPFSLVNWPSRTSYVHWRYSVFLCWFFLVFVWFFSFIIIVYMSSSSLFVLQYPHMSECPHVYYNNIGCGKPSQAARGRDDKGRDSRSKHHR